MGREEFGGTWAGRGEVDRRIRTPRGERRVNRLREGEGGVPKGPWAGNAGWAGRLGRGLQGRPGGGEDPSTGSA